MSFDTLIDRRGTNCAKWDKMEALYGVAPEEGLSMWVADMDFAAPPVVQEKLRQAVEHGVFGYSGGEDSYLDAVQWWWGERHGWTPEREAIFTTQGLVNAMGLLLQTYTQPGDGVILFTPVYHAFHRIIAVNGRKIVQCEMPIEDGKYVLDFDAWDAQMDGSEKMIFLCSPHNPGGRVWTKEELEGMAAFAARHDLILVSDEIHADLTMPGYTHIPMANIEGVRERLITLAASSKTFNIAGLHIGNVIIEDPTLRAPFQQMMTNIWLKASSLAYDAVTAAYSPEGAAWVDELQVYLDGNRTVFDEAVNAIPGLHSMPLEATYLSWVDFAGTGMETEEFTRRVNEEAKIAVNYGPTFGQGGESFLRFNLAMPRSKVITATERLKAAFGDLQ